MEDYKQFLIPTVLAVVLCYSVVTGAEYAKDIIIAFVALMTGANMTKKK